MGRISKEKSTHKTSRNFAFGKYSLALRLTSELVDLRAANADRIPCAARFARYARGTI